MIRTSHQFAVKMGYLKDNLKRLSYKKTGAERPKGEKTCKEKLI